MSTAGDDGGMPLAEVLAVVQVLQAADCRVWVAGGWGVDAWSGV